MKVKVLCVRTKMIGTDIAGYDVLVPTYQKEYHPIAAGCYATVIHRFGEEFFHLADFLRTPEIDGLPPYSQERSDAFKALREKAAQIEKELLAKAFPETKAFDRATMLWHYTKKNSNAKAWLEIEVEVT